MEGRRVREKAKAGMEKGSMQSRDQLEKEFTL